MAQHQGKTEGEMRAGSGTGEDGRLPASRRSTHGEKPEPKPCFSGPDDYFDRPMRSYPRPAKAFYWFALILVMLFTKLYHRWGASGTRPWSDGGSTGTGKVIVANHASMLDPVILIIDAATHGGRLRPLYKSEFDDNRLALWLFSRVGAIPIHRGTADTKAIRRAVSALKSGDDICVFPEGTRVRDPQARPPIHGGFAVIAQMAHCPIVPVGIEGSNRIEPSGKGVPRPVRVRMRYGDPIDFSDVTGATRRERSEAMERLAMGRVYELRDQLAAEAGDGAGKR